MSGSILSLVVALLAVSVLLVPISQRLGLGSVLGYLAAGIFVGPFGLGLIHNVTETLHFSEFGVVLFLFLIGLEVEFKTLLELKSRIFGLGGLQLLLSTGLLAPLLYFYLDLDWIQSSVAAMGFSLSSTAIALQVVKERNLLPTEVGQSSFSILLFQDLAVIPMLALLPLISVTQVANDSRLLNAFKILGILVLVVALGRLLLRHILRLVAQTHLREVFTALSLLLVLGMALLMTWLDLSMGLGAFLAGALLADSEYRHAVETDIEPFKGLLMGLFFMSVGMSIDFGYVASHPVSIAILVAVVVGLKIAVLLALARWFRLPHLHRSFFAIALSQVGEFAFVLFGSAQGFGILKPDTASGLAAVVALSMLTTPLLLTLYTRFVESRRHTSKPEADKIENENSPVIIAGFGRFGQIVGRLLYANKIGATVLDHEPSQIEMVRRFGLKVYYGDATRLDLLHSAGAEQAKVLVVAIDDVDKNLLLIDLVQQHFPHLQIVARARNLQHYYKLIDRQVTVIERELFEGSLRMGVEVLRLLGWPAYRAVTASQKFRRHNVKMIYDLHPSRGNEKEMISRNRQAREDLESMFEQENVLRSQAKQEW